MSIPASTTTCNQSNDCQSYLLTGGLYGTTPNPSNLTAKETNGGTIYLVENAPGYVLEFSVANDIFQWADCRIYPVSTTALAFCLKNSEGNLIAGNSHSM
jgi:hypothetical protein